MTMTNDELLAAWKRKLPNVEPTDRELSAFALGVEVGQADAVKSERSAIAFGDIVQSQVISMRAAVVAAKLESLEVGMVWANRAYARTRAGAVACLTARRPTLELSSRTRSARTTSSAGSEAKGFQCVSCANLVAGLPRRWRRNLRSPNTATSA